MSDPLKFVNYFNHTIEADTIATSGLYTSTSITGFRSNATFVPDATRTNYAYCVGNRVTELDVTMAAAASQNFDPIQMNFNIIGANPTSTSTVNLIYQQLTHDTTAMANLRLKGADWTMTINKNHQDAYIYQGEIDYGAAAVTVGGEVGVGCFTLNASAGAVTGNLRGLIVNVYGAGLPSTTSIGVEVRTDGGSATLAEGIRIWSVGANSITTGIGFRGDIGIALDFVNATFTPDTNRTDIAFALGSRATELDISMAGAATQNFDPVQFNVNIIGTEPTNASTVNLIYSNITHDTTDMTYLRLKCADWNITINKEVQDAYVYQGEIDYGAAATSVNGESAVMSLNMNAGTGAVTGNLRGLIVNCYGAGLPSSTSIGIEVRSDGGTATLAEGIRIWKVGGNTITTGIRFGSAMTNLYRIPVAGTAPTISGVDNYADAEGSIKILVGSTAKYLHYWPNAAA